MEGSVKSLIEAEEQARQIVAAAHEKKNEKVKDARTMADQIINKEREVYDKTYRDEEIKVSDLDCVK
jgi:vacuolar-type H+-ATPase subunit H